MDSVIPDIMQSFNKLSDSSLKLAVESIKEFNESALAAATAATTTTTTTTTTSSTRNQLLPIIESSIWDESYNWLKQISAGESISKFLNCKIEEIPTILKSKSSIKSYLESLQLDQVKDIFVHLSLENLETKDLTKDDMILKIEEEMMMQGIFKLLFRLNKKTLESFSQDLKVKFTDNIASVCDLIMSTMYDLEESPEIPQQTNSPPTTTTTTTTTTSTSSPIKDNSNSTNNNSNSNQNSPTPASTNISTTTSPNTSEKKETPTKSKKGTPMKAPTKKQPGTPNGTSTTTITNSSTTASPSKNSTNTNTVQSSTNTLPTSSSGTGADSNVSNISTTTTTTAATTNNNSNSNNNSTTTTTTTAAAKKKVRSSLDIPSSEKPLTPSLPGKRERKPVPIDPLIQTQISKSPPTATSASIKRSTTTTATANQPSKSTLPTKATKKPIPATKPKSTANISTTTTTTIATSAKKAVPAKRKRDDEQEEVNNRGIYSDVLDEEGDDYLDDEMDEELLSITNNNNNNNYHSNSVSTIEYSNGEPRGYYEDEGKKKWVCPPLEYIKKGVERQYLQNEFNLSDLIEFCKINNLPKNKTKSKTIKIILDFIENGITPPPVGAKKKKKIPSKKSDSGNETTTTTTTTSN